MVTERESLEGLVHPAACEEAQLYIQSHGACVRLMLSRASSLTALLCAWECQEPAEKESLHALFLQMIEMADAVDVLLRRCVPVPACLQVRSMFEALLSVEYIVQEDGPSRALAWQYFRLMERLRQSERQDPSTARGQQWAEAVAHDNVGWALTPPPPAMVHRDVEGARRELLEPRFGAVRKLVEDCGVKHDDGVRHWYSLAGGPKSLRELATHLGRSAQYSALYSYWSEIGHAGDMSYPSCRARSGVTSRPIRDPRMLKQVAVLAVTLLLSAARQIAARMGETEALRAWDIADFRQEFLRLVDELDDPGAAESRDCLENE